MKIKLYPKSGPNDEDNGFTAEEIRRGTPWLYADVTCPHCDKEQPVAATGGIGGPCCRCGKRTDGSA